MTSEQAEDLRAILADTKATDQQILLAALRALEELGRRTDDPPVSELE